MIILLMKLIFHKIYLLKKINLNMRKVNLNKLKFIFKLKYKVK